MRMRVHRLMCCLRWRCMLCLIMVVGGVPPALSESLAPDVMTPNHALDTHTAYYHDAGGSSTLADVRRKTTAFTDVNHSASLNFGYTPSPTWLRARVTNPTGRTQQWRVVFDYPFLDEVTLYRVNKTSSEKLTSGSAVPVSDRATGRRQAVFPLSLAPQETVTLYSRVDTAGSKVLNYRLMTPEAFYARNDLAMFWLAAYFGVLIALGIYHLMLYFGMKERVFLHYALFLFSFTLAIMAFNGIGTLMFWQGMASHSARLMALGLVLAAAMATRFAQSFLNTCRHCPRWHKTLDSWRGACWVAVFATLVLPVQPALRLMDATALTTSLLLLVCAFYGSLRRFPGARMFLLGWATLLLGACVFALRNLGILPANFITLHGIQIGSAVEMLIFALALASRFHQLKRQKDLAQTAMVNTLKSHEAMLERKVTIRTAVLERMAHHDMLTGVLNRNGLAKNAREALKKARQTQRPLALFLLDLDRFKPINDEHGHAAGDFVLKQVANRLQHLTRPGDHCARFGGDEFIMLLENLGNDRTALNDMRTRIIQAIRQPIRLPDGTQVNVGASIGISVFDGTPDAPASLESMMLEADGGMYAAKPQNAREPFGNA